jgi:hypothetical protein
MKARRQLDAKGYEYRGVILDGLVRHLGEPATVAVMTDDNLRSLVNATAQAAADAPTAQVAGRIAVTVIGKLVDALAAAAAEVTA